MPNTATQMCICLLRGDRQAGKSFGSPFAWERCTSEWAPSWREVQDSRALPLSLWAINHLRTSVPNMGQAETDEIYVGLDKKGAHYVFPVQAKGGSDKLNIVQIEQDL